MKNILSFAIGLIAIISIAQEIVKVDFQKQFKGNKGSFVLYNLNTNKTYIYNDSIASKRHSPCSTFKIPNSLIALESGIAKDKNYFIKYDSIKNPAQSWWTNDEPFIHWTQDQTLQSAFKYSVVWYYQELARRIGQRKMRKSLKKIAYGNQDISSGIDNFWLCGSIEISAKEQVLFLKKLYQENLKGFSRKAQKTVKQIMLYETTDSHKLYGKTGAGDCIDNQVIGWYVGFVETPTDSYIFAMNIMVNDFKSLGNHRIDITKKVLNDLAIIE